MNKQDINSLIDSLIIDNERGQITAEVLRNVLKTINEGTADGYVYISAATTNTSPIAIKGDEKVFYIAVKEGVYSNFGINDAISELSIIRTFKGNWVAESLGIPLVDLTIELGDSDRKIVTQKKITELYNEGYKYAGVAHTNDKVEPLNGEKKVFMFILQTGTYSNYGISSEITDFSVITSIGKQWFVESLGIPFKLQSKLTEQEQFNDSFSKSLNQIDKAMKDSVLNLQSQIDLLTEGDASATIESLKEIIAFFTGINDTETLRGILNGLELSLKNEIAKYLPLDGGTMNGDIDMNGKRVDNVGIEEVNSLPTTNLYEGRMVKFKNMTYTFYNGLWLALSDDLRGRVNDTHEENFVYQPTASDLSIKDGFADIKKLKGNTIVWNQKFRNIGFANNGVNITTSENVLILNGTLNTAYVEITRAIDGFARIPLNHIGYYRIVILKDDSNVLQNKYLSLFNRTTLTQITNNTAKSLYQNTNDTLGCGFGFAGFSGGEVVEDVQIKVNIFDLTKMFGEGNEPTIEEFEAMFPNDYYEYNEGELLSFDGKGLKSVGFNQWDEEWEVGMIGHDGNTVPEKNTFCSKNYIKVLPDTDYFFKADGYTGYYACFDENYKNIYPSTGYLSPIEGIKRIPVNCHYIKFFVRGTSVYNNDICINLSHSGYRNGEYEPYEDYKILFQEGKTISRLTGKLNGEGDSVVIFPDGLRSAGEVFDEIVYDKDTGKHKAIKRIGSVDMGILDWTAGSSSSSTNTPIFYTVSVGIRKRGNTPLRTAMYIYNSKNYPEGISNGQINGNHSTNIVYILDSSYTDAASFKQSLSGQILYYELAEPEVYELDFSITTSYDAHDFGTEEVLYNDGNEVNIPMKANIEYGFNAVDMIRNNFEETRTLKERVTVLEQAILQMQAANTASETIGPIEE